MTVTATPIIDAHSHVAGDDQPVQALLSDLQVQCFNICVAQVGGSWDLQRQAYSSIAAQHPERFRWITTCDLPDANDFQNAHAYAERIIAGLERDFAAGAIGCKFWKNIGMEAKTPEDAFLQIDHPIFTPIFAWLERNEHTVLAHIGEPYACWQSLDYVSPHAGYYRQHPRWHMHGRAGVLSHAELMDGFDRFLARHPRLRVVGAHLGSQEYDLNQIARRMQRFPHYAVDTGARNYDLMLHERSTVLDFFARFGDRVLFGLDIGIPQAARQSADARADRITVYRDQFHEAMRFYTSDATQDVQGKTCAGLALSAQQQDRLFRANAQQWYLS